MSIVKPTSGLANWKRKSHPPKLKARFVDIEHLDFIRSLPCLCCGHPPPNSAHHVMRVPTNERGGAMKSGDCWTVPLCFGPYPRGCHMTLHHWEEEKWSLRHNVAALLMYLPASAALLYQMSGNKDACIRAIKDMRG